MNFFKNLKQEALSLEVEKHRYKKINFNKQVYDTDVIQGIFDRINMLEDRIEQLEKEKLKS